MKKITTALFLCAGLMSNAQENINDLLAAGVNDAQRFTQDYLSPAGDGLMYGMNNGWFNSARVKPFLGFEISLIVNGSLIKDGKKSFVLDTSRYENLQFSDGSISKEVSTALGDIEGIEVFVDGGQPGTLDDAVFRLPSGLASEHINFIPTAVLQASVGLIKHTEVKVRLFPKTSYDDAAMTYYGFGVQHELSAWLPADKLLPVAVSGLISYSHLNGEYDFTETEVIAGENQRIQTKADTWMFGLITSTKLPVINFYGSIGYLAGKSDTDLLGTYVVEQGPFQSETIVDPFSVDSKVSGARVTLGTKLKLGFFRINADYTMAAFDSFNLGINFGFR